MCIHINSKHIHNHSLKYILLLQNMTNEHIPLLQSRTPSIQTITTVLNPSEYHNHNFSNNYKRYYGMLYLFLSTPVWAGLAILVKMFSYLPVIQVLWLRYFVQWIIALSCLGLMTFLNIAPHQINNNQLNEKNLKKNNDHNNDNNNNNHVVYSTFQDYENPGDKIFFLIFNHVSFSRFILPRVVLFIFHSQKNIK